MTANDRTSEFRDLLKEKEKSVPDAKRRKFSRSAKRTSDEQRNVQETLNKDYIAEGYNIVRMSVVMSRVRLPEAEHQVAQPHQHPLSYAVVR